MRGEDGLEKIFQLICSNTLPRICETLPLRVLSTVKPNRQMISSSTVRASITNEEHTFNGTVEDITHIKNLR